MRTLNKIIKQFVFSLKLLFKIAVNCYNYVRSAVRLLMTTAHAQNGTDREESMSFAYVSQCHVTHYKPHTN